MSSSQTPTSQQETPQNRFIHIYNTSKANEPNTRQYMVTVLNMINNANNEQDALVRAARAHILINQPTPSSRDIRDFPRAMNADGRFNLKVQGKFNFQFYATKCTYFMQLRIDCIMLHRDYSNNLMQNEQFSANTASENFLQYLKNQCPIVKAATLNAIEENLFKEEVCLFCELLNILVRKIFCCKNEKS